MEPKGVIMPTQKYLALEMERCKGHCKDLAVQQVVEFYSETLALWKIKGSTAKSCIRSRNGKRVD